LKGCVDDPSRDSGLHGEVNGEESEHETGLNGDVEEEEEEGVEDSNT
jgi:hypothetical protein